jgi:hypothetical protein
MILFNFALTTIGNVRNRFCSQAILWHPKLRNSFPIDIYAPKFAKQSSIVNSWDILFWTFSSEKKNNTFRKLIIVSHFMYGRCEISIFSMVPEHEKRICHGNL